MRKKTSKIKIISMSILTILLLVCLGLDVWHGWIRFFAPAKEIHNTYLIGRQTVKQMDIVTGEDVEVSKPFFEVNVFNNGFELKINEVFDETQTGFYSRGLQYIAKNGKEFTFVIKPWDSTLEALMNANKDIDITKHYTYLKDVGTREHTYNYTGEFVVNIGKFKRYEYCNHYYTQKKLYSAKSFTNINFYEYASALGTEFVESTINPINEDTTFKLQIGDKIYGMKLKYDALGLTDDNLIGSNDTHIRYEGDFKQYEYFNVDEYYRAFDIHYLAESIYDSVNGIAKGTSKDIVLRFGDYFEYFVFDGQTYNDKVTIEMKNKLIEYVNSNFLIRVNVFDTNLNSSEKSFFSYYKGNQNVSEEDIEETVTDYTLAKSIKLVTIKDFEWIETNVSGEYIFKLSEDFKSRNEFKRDLILLNIKIDISGFGITCKGIKKESLQEFGIYDASLTNGNTSWQVDYV